MAVTSYFGETYGAHALNQGGAAVIAGLVGAIGGRVLREGYARVSFLGAHEGIMETVLLSAPGKILRDSPAALPRAQMKLMRSAEMLMFSKKGIGQKF